MLSIGLLPDLSDLSIEVNASVPEPIAKAINFSELAERYLTTVNIKEGRVKSYRAIFKLYETITKGKIDRKSFEKFKVTIEKLPKRNIQKYKVIPLDKLIKLKDTPAEDIISHKNCNEYITVVNSVRNMVTRLTA